MIGFVTPSLAQTYDLLQVFFVSVNYFFLSSGPPKFTNRPPTVVHTLLGTNVTLCCEASGSPRPNVEWFQTQKSSVSFPVFQEDGCLLFKMVKENIKVDFICRAKNSFGLAETTTTMIAALLAGIIYQLILLQSFKNM